MYIVMGVSGSVGGTVAGLLLAQGEDVTVLTRTPDNAQEWRDKGAHVAYADVEDVQSLKDAFALGERAFLVNPSADPAGDSDATERRTIANILAALDDSKLEKVVAASTYGARQESSAGDLGTLWEFEESLRNLAVPAAINRAAYYMTNWTAMADLVRESGVVTSMFPTSSEIPMVAPDDIGKAAVRRLTSSFTDVGVQYVEGPERYTPKQVQEAFSAVFDRPIELSVVPRDKWEQTFKEMGMSDASAASYTRMTAISLYEDFDKPASPWRGDVTLHDFMQATLR